MNRQVMAARAAVNIPVRVSMPAHLIYVAPSGQSARASTRVRKSPRLTATQRNSIGRRSEWSRSPYAPFGGWQ